MSIEKVREYFSLYGMENRILEFPVSSATVELAARALGCEPERIAKTLSFKTAGGCVLVVTSGDARIDNGKYKNIFSEKAKMLQKEEVESETGHPVGGVCPFAVKDGVRIYLDISLKRFLTVFPACGSGNSAIELTCDELEKYSGGTWADLCKDWQD